jgi:predicted ATPase
VKFHVKEYRIPLTDKARFPCMVLVTNSWNDYGFRTLFKLFYYDSNGDRHEIGDVKILDLNLQRHGPNRTTELKENFLRLPTHQASLGQSIDYYANLKSLLPNDFQDILAALNDLAINQGLRDRFEDHEGFKVSLLRFSEAEKVLTEANHILFYDEKTIDNKFHFRYSVQLPGANDFHSVDFNFINEVAQSFRSIILIGRNGTGKTQYLSNLASSLCDINSPGDFSPSRPLFSRVIAISFSLFDKFKIPKASKNFSYKYIGFRQGEEILSDEFLNSKLRYSFSQIKKQNREEEWFGFISDIIELRHLGLETKLPIGIEKSFELVINNRSELLSSGQNILVFVITELIANLRRDSIILFDEPETHLHPNAIARLLKVINSILIYYNSYAVIATHSPIVVQETPSKNVRLFDRIGNTPIIKNLPDEFFGENISKITDSVFYRNQVKEVYKEFFDERIANYSIEEINEQFDNKLSMSALLYLNAISKKK